MSVAASMSLTAAQLDLLQSALDARLKRGIYTMDRHYRATTWESLRRRKLLGYYVPPRPFIAPRYKITPLGRAALALAKGGAAP